MNMQRFDKIRREEIEILTFLDENGESKTSGFDSCIGMVGGQHEILGLEVSMHDGHEMADANNSICVVEDIVVGNSGFIVPKFEFLDAIRKIAKENNALIIFDEAMTGFRLAYGGAPEYFGIVPDLTTLGKIIGGGLPVGAYGGRRDIMEMVAPAGHMYQAGTLSGNPLAMAAGIETLKLIKEPGTYEYLDKVTGELVQGILQVGKSAGHSMCGGHINGMFGFFFTEGPVFNFADAKKSDLAKFARFYRGMLKQGVYFAPSQFEVGFTSLAHTTEDIKMTIAARYDMI
ncbi:hypothetical protein JHK82_048921 [Glycine max]|nr:hypothetical protein JHK85_049419 [Glycine max]KAG5099067.1 hypothetical protein JHK82_048921 [Glycine max]